MAADFLHSGYLSRLMSHSLYGNTLCSYAVAAGLFVVILALLYAFKTLAASRLKALAEKTETDLDDLAVEVLLGFRWFEYQLLAFYLAVLHLEKGLWAGRLLNFVLLAVFTLKAVQITRRLTAYWTNRIAAQKNLTGSDRAAVVTSSQVIINALIWVTAALFILDNLGVNISAVLAGLGIGGVAVALAAQAILGDLFNFFVILLDKPFAIGDFVVSDNISGEIERIGLKSTRIRSLSGEIVVISNSNLLASRVKNYQHMAKRRVVFKTSVIYRTSPEALRRIPELIKKAVTGQTGTEFGRSNLSCLGDFSVDFETVYHISNPDYDMYMATQEKVLLSIAEVFSREGLEFAYLTQPFAVNK